MIVWKDPYKSTRRPSSALEKPREAAALGAAATLLPGDAFDEGTVAAPFVDSVTSGSQPLGGWSLCAREGGRCNCVGTVALHSVLADWAMLRHVNGLGLISLEIPYKYTLIYSYETYIIYLYDTYLKMKYCTRPYQCI